MKGPQKKTILVVEDEIPLQKAAAIRLHAHGFHTLTARSVAEAKKHIQSEHIDGLWIDHYLIGEEDGYDFSRYVRTNKKTANLPIFLVTNTANPSRIDRYLALGHVYYYLKSNFSLETIIDEVDRCLSDADHFFSPSATPNNTLL